MPGHIDLDSLSRTDSNGKALAATLTALNGDAQLLAEMSDSEKDVRVSDGSNIIKARLNEDGDVHQILVNDVIVWTPGDEF